MCDINVFLFTQGVEKKIMENVDRVEVNENRIRLLNIFGEEKYVDGQITLFDNSRKSLVVEPR